MFVCDEAYANNKLFRGLYHFVQQQHKDHARINVYNGPDLSPEAGTQSTPYDITHQVNESDGLQIGFVQTHTHTEHNTPSATPRVQCIGFCAPLVRVLFVWIKVCAVSVAAAAAVVFYDDYNDDYNDDNDDRSRL